MVDRPVRSDVARNRERVIQAAREAFVAEDAPRLEAIARSAGVGIATLYRHFPTRDDLAEGVYRADLDALADAAPRLLETHAPADALARWGDLFGERIEAKRAMAGALRAVIASGAVTKESTRSVLGAAAQRILDPGAATGELRADIDGEDLVVALLGPYLACPAPEQAPRARRALRLVIGGVIR